MSASTPAGNPRRAVDPIYSRLPRGPHGIARGEVAANQRTRIHGSMVAAVSRHGVENVTVREVIALAGVSRRSFYEHFASREDCLQRTIGAVATELTGSARRACAEAPPGMCLTAGLARLASDVCAAADGARLVLRHSLAAGDAGAAALGEALAAAERLLGGSLSPHGELLPAGVLRALGGALAQTLAVRLEAPRLPDASNLASELTALAAAQRPSGVAAARRLARALEGRARRTTAAAQRQRPPWHPRERVLASAMRAAARQPLACLGAAQIADGAAMPLDSFHDEFGDVERCLIEAIELCHERLTLIVDRAHALGGGWPEGTRLALAGMLGYLAAEPDQARMIALVAHRAGERARRRNDELELALGAALRRGGPAAAPAAPAIAGAVLGVVRRMLLNGLADRLPGFSDHIAYVVLAPALGAAEAIEVVGGARRPAPLSGGARSDVRRST